MAEALKRYFVGKEEGEERYKTVRKLLGIPESGSDFEYGFGVYGDLNAVIRDFRDYKRWGRWPFGDGSRYSQPVWVIENFQMLELQEEFFELDKVHGIKQAPKGVTRADQLFGTKK